jgi:glutathione S-transferase
MAAVLDQHLRGREYLVGDRVSVADFVAAYTLDWAGEFGLLDGLPALRTYMERLYARPNAPPRIAAAFASLQA